MITQYIIVMKTFSVLALTVVVQSKDTHKTFTQIALENGYSAESYTVVTGDGYIS